MLDQDADWWIAANTPYGWYYYVHPGAWYASSFENIQPAYQGPLFDPSPVEILNISGLPAGTYIIYFGADSKMNGLIDFDQLYIDYVVVNIGP